MKKRVFVVFALTCSIFISSIAPVFAALDPLPASRSPLGISDLYNTDLFTGSSSYSYPIKVPKGTNDLTPDVSLSYNSMAAYGTSAYAGMGWDLDKDYIERDVNFTSGSTSDDKFYLHFKGSTQEFVYVAGDGRYHTKIESNLHISKLTSGEENDYNEYWQVIMPDGTKYRFGQASNSEQVCNGRSYVYRWNLDQVEDRHTNKIFYTYTENSGASYLSKIEYNSEKSRVIDFSYANNPYQRQVYIQGCNISETQRLNDIQIKANSSLVRQFDLSYQTGTNSGQLLQSITERGNTGTASALPATTFSYKPTSNKWSQNPEYWINYAPIGSHLEEPSIQLADVTGDGLLDIVKSVDNGNGNSTWKVYKNLGNSWNTTAELWVNSQPVGAHLSNSDTRLLDVTGDNLPDIIWMQNNSGSLTYKVYRNTGTSWNTTAENWVTNQGSFPNITQGGVVMADVDHDGLVDVVKSHWQTGTPPTWNVYKNTGSAWNTNPDGWSAPLEMYFGDSNVMLSDVNGDGLPDLVRTTNSSNYDTWYVYKNLGAGWSTSADTWINNAPIEAYLGMYNVTLQDMDGDGLPDIVKSTADPVKWYVLLNKGNSWETTWRDWADAQQGGVPAALAPNVQTVDVTGDSLPDVIRTVHTDENVTWQVWINQGSAPYLLSKVNTSQGGEISFDYIKSTAYDNTGADSLSDLPFPLWLVSSMTTNNGMTNSHQTNDVTTYSYKDGFYDWQDREFRGFGEITETLPNSAKRKYLFYQDDALKGRVASVQTTASINIPYLKTESVWGIATNSGVMTVRLDEEKEYTHDGATASAKVKETEYQYDSYGNVTRIAELGDTSTGSDDRFTYNEYNYNPERWIVDKVYLATLKASDDSTEVSKVWKYYDESSSSPGSFGDGSDGSILLSSNTTELPIDSPVSANSSSTTATVGSGLGFAANQIVMFHQTRGTNAGTWELRRVEAYSGATLTLTTALTNAYSSSGSNKAQVRVVPQYVDVTVNSGVTWSAKAWNGTTGGIMAFLANGTVSISGTISGSQKGFIAPGQNANSGTALQGEGTGGVGTNSTSANGNGGGGGVANDAGWEGGGGAGGGHSAVGTNGANAQGGANSPGGTGGGVSGSSDLTTMTFGGAGGQGGRFHTDGSATGGAGGNGGGVIAIFGKTITISGAIANSGGNGGNASGSTASGGGGAGAGGATFLKGEDVTLGSSIITASAGSGGSRTCNSLCGGNGGAGAAGRIRVEYKTTLSGTTSPTASTFQYFTFSLPTPVENAPPVKGDLTREVKWLSGGTNPTTTYTYDSYGNIATMTDANNRTTTYTYDTTKTYPSTVTNAKNQTVTLNYELGTGNLLSSTDPNGLVTSYEYDVYGRITKEIKPYDTSSYPTTSYQYFWDGIAPEGMLVSRLETASSSATLDTYMIVDGLGRKIQTRADVENGSQQRIVDTFYDPNGQIAKETVPYLASSSALTTPTPPPASKFGDGSDGNLTIASNTTEAPIDSSVTATSGTTTATVGSGLGFGVNDIVLFHQTQGTNAGTWEFRRVEAYSGTTLTLTTALTNSYSSSGSNKAQVRVVPQYHNVTVNSGATWTAKAWNGTTGGILSFLADGTVTVTGIINAAGLSGTNWEFGASGGAGVGFHGGAGGQGSSTAQQGEGTAGTGSASTAANGNGGGGGSTPAGAPTIATGGGGGHATSGTSGNASSGGTGGTGGGTAGSSDLTTMVFGGGGGGHAERNGSGGLTNGGGGGGGGGIVFITGATTSVSGAITVNGGNAGTGAGGQAGGAGAGGSVLIKAQIATLGSSLLTASAGTGVAGGTGRIRVEYENSLSGSTSPAASTSQATIPTLPAGVIAPPSSSNTTYVDPDVSAKYTEYDYDPIGRVSIITNPKGDSRTTAYDHWKVTTIDEKGSIKRNYLNAFDKITKVEEVLGATTSATLYTYNARDDLTQITDDKSNVFGFTYDTLSRKTAQSDPDMGTWSYGYDAAGNLTSTTDARGTSVSRTYDELNRLTGVNYPSDSDSSFAYDLGKIGTLSIATDSAGTVTYLYDNRLRKTQEARAIGGTTKITSFAYDALDRLTSQTNPDSETVTYSFNNQGEIESATGSASLVSNFDYNALGKITKKDFGNSVTTNYTYNTNDFRLNRIQTPSLFDKNYTYDDVGNISTITDNLLSKTQTFTYDDLDRLKTATESAGFNYAYDYNSIGNLTKFTNAGIDTNYTYGSGSAYIKPHALTASSGSATQSATTVNSQVSASSDDAEENVAGSVDLVSSDLELTCDTSTNPCPSNHAEKQQIGMRFGSLAIPQGATITSAYVEFTADEAQSETTNLTFYGQAADNVSTFSTSASNISSRTKTSASVVWNSVPTWAVGTKYQTPDLSTLVQEIVNRSGWVSGNAAGIIVTGLGHRTAESYDGSSTSAPKLVVTYTTSQTPTYTFYKGVNFNGNAVTIEGNLWASMSGALSNGLSVPSGYNTASTSITPSPSVDSDTNAMLNSVIWKQTAPLTVDQTLPNGNYQIYLWSIENWQSYFRKINVKLEGAQVATEIGNLAYGNWEKYGPYDVTVSDGTLNMEFINVQGDPGFMGMAIYQETEVASSSATYTYDNNGNMLTDALHLFEYNEANQLKRVKLASNSATLAEYVYDYTGKRIVKKNYVNGSLANTVTSWTPSYETKVIEGGSTETTVYYYANNELVARKNNDGTKTYYHTDHLGSTSVLTNQAGSLVESTTYDPFGKVLSGGTNSRFQYTGQEKDSETGLHYYNARYYNPDIRRFTQPDDIIQDIYHPQSLNRYSYVWNNPLRYTDPSGHFVSAILRAITTAVRVVTLYKAVEPVIKQISTKSPSVIKAADTATKTNNPKPQPQNLGNTVSTVSKQGGDAMSKTASNVGGSIKSSFSTSSKTSLWPGPSASGSRVTLNGSTYTHHALESMSPNGMIFHPKTGEMISNGIPPSVVQNAIQHGTKIPGSEPGTVRHIYENVTIVTDLTNKVVITTWKTGH